MKLKAYVPLFAVLAGLCGAAVRGVNLITGYEAGTGLPVRGSLSESGLVALSVVVAAALAVWALQYRADRGVPFEAAFSGGGVLFKMISVICGLVMCAAGAAGLAVTVSANTGVPAAANLPLFPLWLLAILTGACFIAIAAALGRGQMTEGSASMTIIPMFWACFDLIITFKENGASPFVGMYAFELLAATMLTYAFYVLAGFLYSEGRPARFVFGAGGAVFFSMVCVGGAAAVLATGAAAPPQGTLLRYACFLASAVWLLAMLVLLARSRTRDTSAS